MSHAMAPAATSSRAVFIGDVIGRATRWARSERARPRWRRSLATRAADGKGARWRPVGGPHLGGHDELPGPELGIEGRGPGRTGPPASPGANDLPHAGAGPTRLLHAPRRRS